MAKTKNERNAHFVIKVPIYNIEVLFIVAPKPSIMQSKFSEYHHTEIEWQEYVESTSKAGFDGVVDKLSTGKIVCSIRITPSRVKSPYWLGVISHEVGTHVVESIADTIGMPVSKDTEEPRAYLASFLIEQFFCKIKENPSGQ